MRKRTFILAIVAAAASVTIGFGWAAQPSTSPAIAGSTGEMAGAGRDPSLASSKRDQLVGRESSLAASEPLIAGSAGTSLKVVRESA